MTEGKAKVILDVLLCDAIGMQINEKPNSPKRQLANDREIALRLAIQALEMQYEVKRKRIWLKYFYEYETISVKDAINAFEDCIAQGKAKP